MAFKQNIILLFVALMSSAVLADFEEYDVETLKNMLRAQAECPKAYSVYANSCQNKFANDVAQCNDNEDRALLKLKDESLVNRQEFAQTTEQTCNELKLCSDSNDPAVVYDCYALKSTKSADTFGSTYFRASSLQTSYNAAIATIGSNKTSCYEKSSKDLSDNTNKGMVELQSCMKTGQFVLAPIISVAPTKAPAVTEAVVSGVTENPEAEA